MWYVEKCVSIMNEFMFWINIDLGNIFDVNYVMLFNVMNFFGK